MDHRGWQRVAAARSRVIVLSIAVLLGGCGDADTGASRSGGTTSQGQGFTGGSIEDCGTFKLGQMLRDLHGRHKAAGPYTVVVAEIGQPGSSEYATDDNARPSGPPYSHAIFTAYPVTDVRHVAGPPLEHDKIVIEGGVIGTDEVYGPGDDGVVPGEQALLALKPSRLPGTHGMPTVDFSLPIRDSEVFVDDCWDVRDIPGSKRAAKVKVGLAVGRATTYQDKPGHWVELSAVVAAAQAR